MLSGENLRSYVLQGRTRLWVAKLPPTTGAATCHTQTRLPRTTAPGSAATGSAAAGGGAGAEMHWLFAVPPRGD